MPQMDPLTLEMLKRLSGAQPTPRPKSPVDALRAIGFKLPSPDESMPLRPGEDMPGASPKWIDPYLEGLLGATGVGADTKANRAGQMLSTVIPFVGSAVKGAKGLWSASRLPGVTKSLKPSMATPELVGGYSAEQLLAHPGAGAVMERLSAQSKPTFEAMRDAGAFAGNRAVGGLGSVTESSPTLRGPLQKTLGEMNPEFAAVGAEAKYNIGRQPTEKLGDPAFKAYLRLLSQGGR